MKRCCIFLHSGSYDRVYQALAISSVILAGGGEVHVFLSYGALKRFSKGNLDAPVIEGEPAPFSDEFKKHIERGAIEPISEMVETAKTFGRFSLYACSASMAVLNIARDELADEVDSSMGLVSFLNIVKEADLTLYI